MNTILAALTIAALPNITTNPFTPDATWSYRAPDGVITINDGTQYNPHDPQHLTAKTCEFIGTNPRTVDELGCEGTIAGGDPGAPFATCGNHCIVPEVHDWSTVYKIRIGLQVEALEDWGGCGIYDFLNHLEASFQTIFAPYLAVGAFVQIQHVHFMSKGYTFNALGNSTAVNEAKDIWPTLQMAAPVNIVFRLSSRFAGGTAHEDGPCAELKISRVGYQFDIPIHSAATNNRNYDLHYVAHEIGHHILGLSHTGRYYESEESEYPIERCTGDQFYNGEFVCPIWQHQSFMGYCYGCGNESSGDTNLRFGPIMKKVARTNLNYFGPKCLGPSVSIIPEGFDSGHNDFDGDGVPNIMDSCRAVKNADQVNVDIDGAGDACDGGCQICHVEDPRDVGHWSFLIVSLLAIILLRIAR